MSTRALLCVTFCELQCFFWSSTLTDCGVFFVQVFKRSPPTPPSYAQAVAIDTSVIADHNYLASLKRLVHNRSFILLLMTYGELWSLLLLLLLALITYYYLVSGMIQCYVCHLLSVFGSRMDKLQLNWLRQPSFFMKKFLNLIFSFADYACKPGDIVLRATFEGVKTVVGYTSTYHYKCTHHLGFHSFFL